MTHSYAIYPSLQDRHVLITGGASGIGACLVTEFSKQGSCVTFLDIDSAAGEALVIRLTDETRHTPLFVPCDLTQIENLQTAIAAGVSKHGPVHVLVNNAANDRRHHIESTTPADWDSTIAVNLKHYFFAAQAVIAGMREQGGGCIINFGSIAWMNKTSNLPVYASAKAAVHGLTHALARDLGADHIRVNTIVPGWVMTEKQLTLWINAEAEKLIEASQCLPDRLQPADLARMTLFLAADDSRMCTGQDFIVDAGWT
jgi:NAD(P)-dependent dehydrogenase (short-subunit alcohol dehydrogenase family)